MTLKKQGKKTLKNKLNDSNESNSNKNNLEYNNLNYTESKKTAQKWFQKIII